MDVIRIARHYLAGHWGAVATILALQLTQIIFNLFLPSINASIIDDGILAKDIGTIWRLGGVMLALAAAQMVCNIAAIVVSSKLSLDFGRRLRRDIFTHVQSFSETERHRFGAATLITRTTNDTNQVQNVVMMTFTVIVTAPIMGIGGVIMAIQQDIQLSTLLLIIVPVLAILVVSVMRVLGPMHQTQQKRIDRVSALLRESLTGVRVIRAFNQQEAERTKFRTANLALRNIWMRIATLWALLMPATSLIIGLSSVAVVWFAGHRIDAGQMQVGALTAFISYLMMILGAVMMTGMMMMMFPRAAVSAGRLREIQDTEPSITQPAECAAMPASPMTFELEDVTIRFEDAEKPVLSDLNLTIAPGTTTAVVGSTGSGKSSLIRLFARIIDPSDGVVRAGGVDVRALNLRELREKVVYIPQTAYLFTGTVASNVASLIEPGGEDRAKVRRALEVAQALEFVDALEGGIDAKVEAGGKNFSGGQRQRLAIARAIYRALPTDTSPAADLVIFDDSFSALDFATDAALRAALHEALAGTAVVIVASRIATVRNADAIVVLDRGHMAGLGTHSQLMESCAPYREIVESQLSAQEAAS